MRLDFPLTAWKVSKYGDISGPYFPEFRLNEEISEYKKILIRNNSVFGHFSCSVCLWQKSSDTLIKLNSDTFLSHSLSWGIESFPIHKNIIYLFWYFSSPIFNKLFIFVFWSTLSYENYLSRQNCRFCNYPMLLNNKKIL